MKAFEYAQATTEAEILDLLSSRAGHTELLAGGTDLVGLMGKMVVTPERVVNIMEVPSLQTIESLPDGSVRIGAAVHLDTLMANPYLADYPAVLQAIAGINSLQLQAQGTIGGEICQRPRCWYYRAGLDDLHGSEAMAAEGSNEQHAIFGNSGPAKFVCGSRTAPAFIALGAKVRLLGPTADDEQYISVEDFYRMPRRDDQRENVLAPNQLVTHIVLPPASDSGGETGNATYEVRHGEGPDYPLASAAAKLEFSGDVVSKAQIVLGQVAPTPWISQQAAQSIIGQRVTDHSADLAGLAAVSVATPLSENEYKVQLARVAVKRAILLAAGYETGGF